MNTELQLISSTATLFEEQCGFFCPQLSLSRLPANGFALLCFLPAPATCRLTALRCDPRLRMGALPLFLLCLPGE